MSSAFWFLLDEDILKKVPVIGFGGCREEIVSGDKQGGSLGRARGLTVLSHHIDVIVQAKIRRAPAPLKVSDRPKPSRRRCSLERISRKPTFQLVIILLQHSSPASPRPEAAERLSTRHVLSSAADLLLWVRTRRPPLVLL